MTIVFMCRFGDEESLDYKRRGESAMRRNRFYRVLLGLAVFMLMFAAGMPAAKADETDGTVTVTYDANGGEFYNVDGVTRAPSGDSFGDRITEKVASGSESSLFYEGEQFEYTSYGDSYDDSITVTFPTSYFESCIESSAVEGSFGSLFPYREGYAIVGWTVKNSAGEIIGTIPEVIPDEKYKELSNDQLSLLKSDEIQLKKTMEHYIPTQDVTLSAIWEEGSTVVFYNDLEEYNKSQTRFFSKNMYIYVGYPVETLYDSEAYEKNYWTGYRDRETGTLYKKGDIIPTDRDLVLEEVFMPAATVTYKSGDKEFSSESISRIGFYNQDERGYYGVTDRFFGSRVFGNRVYLKDKDIEADAYISKEINVGEIGIIKDMLYSENMEAFAVGWSIEGDDSGKIYKHGETYKVTGDVTFVAVWGETKGVYYDMNGGDIIYEPGYYDSGFLSETVAVGEEHKIYEFDPEKYNDGLPVKPGYSFKGWVDKDTNEFYKPGDVITISSSLILRADWERSDKRDDRASKIFNDAPLVIYDAGDGSFTDKIDGRLLSDDDDSFRAFYSRRSENGLKVGYFEGYNTESYEDLWYTNFDGYFISEPFELKGREGYRFAGWKLEGDKDEGKLYKTGDSFVIPTDKDGNYSDVKFTAQWEEVKEIQLTVNYDFNGGNGEYYDYEDLESSRIEDSVYSIKVPNQFVSAVGDKIYIGSDPSLAGRAFYASREGYYFLGWKLKDDESGKLYRHDDEVVVTSDEMTFVAQWTDYVDTYPKDAKSIDISSLSANVSGTLKSHDDKHIYKITLPVGKSMKIDLALSGEGVGNEVETIKDIPTQWDSGHYWMGASSLIDGMLFVKHESGISFDKAIRPWPSDTVFNGKPVSLYLNEGTYYIIIDAKTHIPEIRTDEGGNVTYHNFGNDTNYLSYNYKLDIKLTEVPDIAKGKRNSRLFRNAVDINVGDTVNGVVPICSYGGVDGSSSISFDEVYRFTLDKKSSITAALSGLNADAIYTYIFFYKEGKVPYYASPVASNGADVTYVGKMIDGKFIERKTNSSSLTTELEPGTYFLKLEINDGALQDMLYYGTPYTLSLTADGASKSISSCTVSGLSAKAYTGKAITPAVTVKDGATVLKKGTDYTVAYSNNTKVGTATVTITGKGSYSGTLTKTFAIKKVSFKYRAYVQKKNWMAWSTAKVSGTSASDMAGTTDNLRMETIQMQLSGVSGKIEYRAYVEKMGWTQWATTSDTKTYAGTKGMSRRVEMIQLKASGQVATLYDMYYRAYSEKFGWLGWAKSGEKAGSAGYARKLEAFQVNFVRKGESFKITSDRAKCFYDKTKDGANPK